MCRSVPATRPVRATKMAALPLQSHHALFRPHLQTCTASPITNLHQAFIPSIMQDSVTKAPAELR